MYLTLLNSALKNGQDGKFYVMCILPQFKNFKTLREWDIVIKR